MPLVIGVLLALVVSLLAWAAGFDRDRSFYPTVLCVVASYYVLFAAMGGGSVPVLVAESVTWTAFALVAFLGFKSNLWWVAAALAGHGAFDFVHGEGPADRAEHGVVRGGEGGQRRLRYLSHQDRRSDDASVLLRSRRLR